MNAYDEQLDLTRFEPIRRRAPQFSYPRRSPGRAATGMHRRRRRHWRPACKSAPAGSAAS